MGEVDEVLDNKEKGIFLAEIKRKQRLRKSSDRQSEAYSSSVTKKNASNIKHGVIHTPSQRIKPIASSSRRDHPLRSGAGKYGSIAKSNRLKRKQQYVNRYSSQDPKNIEKQIQKYNDLLMN